MRNLLVRLCSLWIVLGVAALASAQSPEASPTSATEPAPEAGGRRAREFQGDDLGQVLRLLARQAKISLAVSEAVKGTVNVRLENVTAMEAIGILVRLDKLSMTKDEKGIYYIDVPDLAVARLDALVKLETAEQIALYKRNLYDALIKKQGFSSGEALQLTAASDPATLLMALDRKPDPTPAK